jgi:hypothetical protein
LNKSFNDKLLGGAYKLNATHALNKFKKHKTSKRSWKFKIELRRFYQILKLKLWKR